MEKGLPEQVIKTSKREGGKGGGNLIFNFQNLKNLFVVKTDFRLFL